MQGFNRLVNYPRLGSPGWLQFFDCFLKEVHNGMLDVPRVRLEVRRAYYVQDVRGDGLAAARHDHAATVSGCDQRLG